MHLIQLQKYLFRNSKQKRHFHEYVVSYCISDRI